MVSHVISHAKVCLFEPHILNYIHLKIDPYDGYEIKSWSQNITNCRKDTWFTIRKDCHRAVPCYSEFNTRKIKLCVCVCVGIKETQVISRIFFQAEDVRRVSFFNLQPLFQLLPTILSPTITKQNATESVVSYFTTVDFNRFVSRFQTFFFSSSSSDALRNVMFPFSSQGKAIGSLILYFLHYHQ